MRIIELSNQPAEMLTEVRQRRLAAERERSARHDTALAAHQAQIKQARKVVREARAARRWGAWLLAGRSLSRLRWHVPMAPPPIDWDDSEERILAAGIASEQKTVDDLSGQLGDDWILVRGYRNRAGEIDHILLGPGGLIAVENEFFEGTVHCQGDDWWSDARDRHGNVVGSLTIADRRGRSPSVRLNQAADRLQRFLRSRGHPLLVQRVLLFTHPRSRLGRCRRATVRVALSAGDVLDLIRRCLPVFDSGQVTQLQQLIERDHRFHNARRTFRTAQSSGQAEEPD